MTKADKYFKKQAKKILKKGTEQETRAKWEDGTRAKTKAIFGTKTRYNLKEGFPITNFRRQYLKSAIKEILWIHQKYSNIVEELGSLKNIWEKWVKNDGTIGKSYGYQAGKKYKWSDTPEQMTQIERVLYLLKTDKNNRRLAITFINNEETIEKSLQECAHTIEFTVIGKTLNAVLYQRSGDFLTASSPGGWKEIQYAALTMMIAHCSDLEPGEFMHTVVNQHIYDHHEKIIKEILKEKTKEKQPKVFIKPGATKNFFELTEKDFVVLDYEPNENEGLKIELAV